MRYHAIRNTADLFTSPELAVVAVVDAAVDVCLVALVVAHPEDDRDDDELPIERRAARALVTALHDLTHAINRYRLALERAKERDREFTDDPF